MPTPAPSLKIAVGEALVCFKLGGRATFATSVDFKTAAEALRLRQRTQFVLDLTDCLAMDSTFLGVLAGFAQRLTENPGQPGQLTLVNANPRITDFLDNLGVLGLFRLVQQATPLEAKFDAVCGAEPTKTELSRVSLEAHQTLMEINPANIPRFRDVARFLADDLKRGELKRGQ
jgi:anti-anti-sigma factor